jgi:serine/threonine protein kinase
MYKRYYLKKLFLILSLYFCKEYLGISFKGLNFKCGDGKYNREFEEMNLIDFGNYGIVCKAMDRKSNAIFAIKKIPFNEGLSDSALKEIQFLQNLRSHLICRLESVWVENNYLNSDDYKTEENKNSILNSEIFKSNKALLLHIQMEFCLMTLRDVTTKLNNELNRKRSEVMTPLGYYISSQLFEEILESVDYLHKQTVIHRDLKPNNILITDGMKGRFVKIADFGLATIHEFDGQSHTKYKGTIRYAAPEVMTSTKYDTKADIYSLGVIQQELFNIDINEYLKCKLLFNIFHLLFFNKFQANRRGL